MKAVLLVFAFLIPALADSLPQWALMAISRTASADAPKGADAWVLLDRTEYRYAGDGEVRKQRFRVVRVLTRFGAGAGTYSIEGLGGKYSQVKKLKGWHQDSLGKCQSIEKDNVLTLDPDSSDEVSGEVLTTTTLPGVGPGSIVAFESRESIRHPVGPIFTATILQNHPIAHWEMVTETGWFAPSGITFAVEIRGGERFGLQNLGGAGSAVFANLPGRPSAEPLAPPGMFREPRLYLKVMDPKLNPAQFNRWQDLGKWYFSRFQEVIELVNPLDSHSPELTANLASILSWMDRNLIYRSVALDSIRNWLPAKTTIVRRRGYGDCKEFVAFLAGALKTDRIQVCPALACLSPDRVPTDEPISPFAFNHLIAAIPVDRPTGLPSEIQTSLGRQLLVDPTCPWLPLGQLPAPLAGSRVLVCLPEGGEWVEVPRQCTEPRDWKITLDGTVKVDGSFHGAVRISEKQDSLHFRETFRRSGLTGIKDLAGRLLGLGPSASWTLQAWDPSRDESGYRTVLLQAVVPGLLMAKGDRAELTLLGPGILPPLMTRLGEERAWDIQIPPRGGFRYEGRLRIEGSAVQPEKQRSLTTGWIETKWEAEGKKGEFTFALESVQRGLSADFPSHRPVAVQVNRDRDRISDFLESIRQVKLVQEPSVPEPPIVQPKPPAEMPARKKPSRKGNNERG